MGTAVLWWLTIEILSLVGLPIAAVLFAALPDRGWALAKPLSLLLVGWLIWFPLMLVPALPYSRAWIFGTCLAFAAGNAALLRRPRIRVELLRMLTSQRLYLLLCELIFAVAFAVLIWLRSFTPAVVDTEKFMDVAFLSAIWRAPHLPPPDPWLSGYTLNYYYFGHFLLATVAKLLGTVPAVAFNIGLALIFALTSVALFGVATNLAAARHGPHVSLARASSAGIVSIFLVLVCGNLAGAREWWSEAAAVSAHTLPGLMNPWQWWLHPALWASYNWWAPSRVIVNTINEFPAFSFVLADLHAHVLALPFVVMAVGVAVNLLLSGGVGLRVYGRGISGGLALLGSAVALGSLYAINGWDMPTYLGLALLALCLQQWLAHDGRWSVTLLRDAGAAVASLVALALLCYAPFYLTFSSPSEGVGLVPGAVRSPVGDVFAIFGLPAFIAASYLVVRLAPWVGGELPLRPQATVPRVISESGTSPRYQTRIMAGGIVVAGIALVLFAWTRATLGYANWTVFWSLLFLLTSVALILRALGFRWTLTEEVIPAPRWRDRADIWLLCLVGSAALLVGICEFVYLRDVFNFAGAGQLGPDFRMNTVFKLYYQAEVLAGIAGGPVVALLCARGAAVFGMRARDAALVRKASPPSQAEIGYATAVMSHGAATASAATESAATESAATESAATESAATERLGGVVPLGGDDSGRDASGAEGPQLPVASDGLSYSLSGARLAAPGWRRLLRLVSAGGIVLWIGALLALSGAAAVYPVLATAARTQNYSGPHSLDGAAFMSHLPDMQGDAAAIAWLNADVAGNPVIVEGASYAEYTHYGRISAFTGLPTLLGWGGHELQWRYNWLLQPGHAGVLEARENAATTIYTNPNDRIVLATLHTYAVRYVYVGASERMLYPQADLGRFSRFLRVVYSHAGVTIYAVP